MAEDTRPSKPLRVPPGETLIAEGWGTRLYVRHGLLTVSDGQDQLVHTPRARAKGLRVVVLGRAGSISVEALRWIADAGVVFALIDAAAGRVVCSSVDVGLADARLRRAQALAGVPPSPVGLEIARYLIGKKIAGALWVLENDFSGREREATQLRDALGALPKAQTVEKIALIESACAATYWSCFTEIELGFARKDAGRVPEHWRRFGTRASAITGGPRLASTPANAALNYLNALAEVECRVALLALGADPALGVIHRDTPARDSFALDLIEVVRPYLESFLLSLITSRVFSKSDFYETQRGVFRVGAGLARQLAETMPAWRQLVAPHAEHVIGLIASSSPLPIRTPTKLTQSKRSTGRDPYRKAEQRKRTRERVAERMVPNACRECGEVLRSRSRLLCDACSALQRVGQVQQVGRASLSAMRAQGEADPARTREARAKLGATQARQARERAQWERAHPEEKPDPAVFRAEILPGLAGIPVARIARETGLSTVQAWYIRRGERVPHPRFWGALAALVSDLSDRP